MNESNKGQNLPLSINLKESKSQRILTQFESMKTYWTTKKEQLALKAGKESIDQGLLNATDDFRRRVEYSEMVEKSHS